MNDGIRRWIAGGSVKDPLVAVSRFGLPGRAIEELKEHADVVVWPETRPPTPSELAQFARQAHGLICVSSDHVDDALIERCPRLVAVGTVSVGFDHLDLAALTRNGILASNAPDVLTETTADLAWALMLAVRRRIVEGALLVRGGGWTVPDGFDLLPADDVHGSTLGIIGYGRVGRAVARRAGGFSMRVVQFSVPHEDADEWSESMELDGVLRAADIVTLHVTLSKTTEGFFGGAQLKLMKPTAILVNASRGKVVDEAALVSALREGRIAGAGLDVVAREPIEPTNPLLSLPICVILPHVGSATVATRSKMVRLAADGVTKALAGVVPEHLLNPDAVQRG